MKSYNNLWADFLSDENIKLAYKEYLRGTTKDYRTKKLFAKNPDEAIRRARNYALARKTENHYSKTITDGSSGKKRVIIRPQIREQILHHMAINILKPIFLRPMYQHTHGSLPNRGCVSGRKRLEKWIKRDYRGTKYFLKMDIKKYFDSIPHDKLKGMLSKLIKDKKFLSVVFTFIDVKSDGKVLEKGIPLGFYPSQWFANFYLTALDHYIKEELQAPYYMRYMDDMVVLSGNKRKLRKIRIKIAEYLETILGLRLKNNWILLKLGKEDNNALDFMGFRFYSNRVTLRRALMYRLARKAKSIYKKGATIYTSRQFLSLSGWTKHAQVYNMYQKWVAPYCSKRAIRLKVGRYDRRRNYELQFA